MKKVTYAKYNRERAPRFQISTILYEEDGQIYAEKRPLCAQADEHIQSFEEKYQRLKGTYENIQFLRPQQSTQGVRFPFVYGECVGKLLEQNLTNVPHLLEMIQKYEKIIFQYNEQEKTEFVETPEFVEAFGEAPQELLGTSAVQVANLDTNYENFIISDGKWYCIDYEWVMFFAVPTEFLRFRALYYFYNKNRDILEEQIEEADFYEKNGISAEHRQYFENMEDHFQQYVHGEQRRYMYMSNYGKNAITFEEAIASRDRKILEDTQEIIQTHQRLADTIEQVKQTNEHLRNTTRELETHKNLLAVYKDYVEKHQRAMRNPAYAAYLAGKKLGRGVKKVGTSAGEGCKGAAKKLLPKRVYQTAVILHHEGKEGLKYALEASKYGDNAMYMMWMKENEKDLYETKPLSYRPLISVVVPVYNVADSMLEEMIASVRTQTYQNWELVLVDDKSTQPNVAATLKKYVNIPKIKVVFREENGHISKATNTGFANATGEFVALLDCDDLLAPNALYEMASMLNQNPDYDFIYSDEDKISEDGKERRDPFFKPDWSPDTFMSYMYTCHFAMYRKSLIDELGGMREGLEGSQDYDLVLRVMEKTKNIGHIPKILYHWRMRKESTANDLTAKPYIIESTIRAKEDALARRGVKGTLTCIDEITQYRVTYEPIGEPLISIIIPSKDNYDVLEQCLTSIDEVSTYRKYEIIVVDNGSSDENRERYKKLIQKYQGRYYYQPEPFNFSHMCNLGASHAKGELLLFLNDDIKVTEPQWLTIMAGQAGQKHTGAVGCKLLYPDSTLIQHAGVVNYEIGPGHAFHKMDDTLNLYWGRNILDYNYTIVTGACLMVDAAKYKEIGGFEESLPISYNDVDLCFKLVEHGYFNVLRNDVTLYHYESVTRGLDVAPEKAARLKREMAHLYEMHPNFVGYDPCYNPNLVPDRGDFSFNLHGNAQAQHPIADFTRDGLVNGKKQLRFAVDQILDTQKSLQISGWIHNVQEKGKCKQVPIIMLKGADGELLAFHAERIHRPDLVRVFGKNASEAGFKCKIDKSDLKDTEYRIGIVLGGKYINTEQQV